MISYCGYSQFGTARPISVQLRKKRIHNISSAEQRMGKEDGVLARHSVECTGNIDWEGAKIVGRETGLRQRKVREGIESLRNDTME